MANKSSVDNLSFSRRATIRDKSFEPRYHGFEKHTDYIQKQRLIAQELEVATNNLIPPEDIYTYRVAPKHETLATYGQRPCIVIYISSPKGENHAMMHYFSSYGSDNSTIVKKMIKDYVETESLANKSFDKKDIQVTLIHNQSFLNSHSLSIPFIGFPPHIKTVFEHFRAFDQILHALHWEGIAECKNIVSFADKGFLPKSQRNGLCVSALENKILCCDCAILMSDEELQTRKLYNMYSFNIKYPAENEQYMTALETDKKGNPVITHRGQNFSCIHDANKQNRVEEARDNHQDRHGAFAKMSSHVKTALMKNEDHKNSLLNPNKTNRSE